MWGGEEREGEEGCKGEGYKGGGCNELPSRHELALPTVLQDMFN